MDRRSLVQLLIRPGNAAGQPCLKLSANKFIAEDAWAGLAVHQREFLRCYAAGTGSRKAVLVGRSAAIIHGLWTLPEHHAPVLLVVPGKKPPARAGWADGMEYRSLDVPPRDIRTIECATPGDVLRATTPARTAVDVARLHGVRAGVVAMDSLFHGITPVEQLAIRRELESTIARLAGKKGIGQARKALEWSSTRSESPYESLLRVILRERGIIVDEQMWIGRFVRPDLLWDQLAIEVDGRVKTQQHAEQVARDQLDRENWMRKMVYEVARFQPKQILHNEDVCVQEILELKARSEMLGTPRVPATRERPRTGEHWRP